MNTISMSAGAILAVLAAGLAGECTSAQASEPVMRPAINGQMRGYVFTRFIYARSSNELTTDCPEGLAMGLREAFIAQLPPADRPRAEQIHGFSAVGHTILATDNPANGLKLGISDEELAKLSDAEREADTKRMWDPNRHTICNNPADYKGVGFHTIDHAGPASGMNLDGTSDGHATATTCAHKKFSGADGTGGIDNQFWRATGCIAVYRKGGFDFDSTIRAGEWGVLMEVSAPKGGGPDGDVDVNFYSTKDGVTLDAGGKIPAGLSLEYIDDPGLIMRTHGKIENGVLTTDPADFTYKFDNQIIHNRWSFEGARFRLTMMPDGSLKGQMGAYADVDKFYGYTAKAMTINGAVANAIDCPAYYAALRALADGHRDPKTGTCSAVSIAFDLDAVPAFIIHPQKTAQASSGLPATSRNQ